MADELPSSWLDLNLHQPAHGQATAKSPADTTVREDPTRDEQVNVLENLCRKLDQNHAGGRSKNSREEEGIAGRRGESLSLLERLERVAKTRGRRGGEEDHQQR